MSQNKNEYILWIVENPKNKQNINYKKQLMVQFLNFKVIVDCLIDNIINILMIIDFYNTYIIINGSIYVNFVKKFKEKMKDINVIPKFIIFDPNNILNNNNDLLNSYFNYGKKHNSFDTIILFIKNDINIQ